MYVIITKNLKFFENKISFSGSFSPFVQNVTSTCSVLTIMAISYERYIAICQPLQVNDFLSKIQIKDKFSAFF